MYAKTQPNVRQNTANPSRHRAAEPQGMQHYEGCCVIMPKVTSNVSRVYANGYERL